MDQQQKKQAPFSGAYLLLAFAALLFVQGLIAKQTAPKTVPMSELRQEVRDGKVNEVLIRDADAEGGQVHRLHTRHQRAREILTEKRDILESMTRRLLEVETLDRTEIETITGGPLGVPVAAAKA